MAGKWPSSTRSRTRSFYEAAKQVYRPQKSITRSVLDRLDELGSCGLVDGRRIDGVAGDACLHGCRERDHRLLAAGTMGNCRRTSASDKRVQKPFLTFRQPNVAMLLRLVAPHVIPSLWYKFGRFLPMLFSEGRVVAVRRTGRFVETYDIGVAKNHNFFADGILIHNCQHDAASSCAHLHNVIRPRWILGLSATPFRTDRVKLCFDEVVKDAGIHQLIQDGYLSQFDHYTIPKWDVSQLADRYCAEPDRWGKSIFFFHSVEECRATQRDCCRSRGIASDVVTGSTDRESQLAAFRAGDLAGADQLHGADGGL